MAKLFGTDGVRGEANKELTPELAFRLGKAGAYVLGKNSFDTKIIIGKDTRISGDMLESALAAGVCSMGVDVLRVGVLPTPGIAYLTRVHQVNAGIVISASHNPFQDNGIKFFSGSGFKLPDEVEDEIEKYLELADSLERPTGNKIGRIVNWESAAQDYADFLTSVAPSLEGLKIVLDCANGAASKIGPEILKARGAEVIPLFNQPDGVNINVNCGSTHPEVLAKEVVAQKADIGLACDGDADRVIAVDERGNIIDGDCIMAVCALALQEKGELHNNSVAVTVMSNLGLHKILSESGIKVYQTKVGDRYVMEKLLETGAVLGGEQSGHIIFLNHNTTGDGLLTGLKLLSVLKEKNAKVSEIAAQMQRFPQVLFNVRVKNKDKVMNNDLVKNKVEEIAASLGEDGRILVRQSGTESLIRIMLEGLDQELLKKFAEEVMDIVKKIDILS